MRTSIVAIMIILGIAACLRPTKRVPEPGIAETVTKHPELRGK